jgi:two-component system nitrogen regulation response regulator GlnG
MEHFLHKVAVELDVEAKTLKADVLIRLETFSWPGNVRQLENIARWLTVMASGQEIHVQDLPPEILGETGDALPAKNNRGNWENVLQGWVQSCYEQGKTGLLNEVEAVLVKAALQATGDKKREAAQLLGWGRNTLTRKLKGME